MGYHTDFDGSFALDEPLNEEQVIYLKAFAKTRRMARDVEEYLASDRSRLFETVGLDIGVQGMYVADGAGWEMNEYHQLCLIKEPDDGGGGYNTPPTGQPGLWCQWIPNDEGTEILWNGHEKFYHYVDWIKWLIEHFFEPWGRTLNGYVRFQGGERDDRGAIYIKDNKVEQVFDEVSNAGPSWD